MTDLRPTFGKRPLRRSAILEHLAAIRYRTGRRYPCVILDGGFATEIERLGHDLSTTATQGEWAAAVLHKAPHDVQRVHRRYLEAGAEILTSASYQASMASIPTAVEVLARSLDRLDTQASYVLRAVSLGPLAARLGGGLEYRGYADTEIFAAGDEAARETFRRYHEPRIAACVPFFAENSNDRDLTGDGTVPRADFILFETVPDALEATCISELMTSDTRFENIPWAISLQCRLASSSPPLAPESSERCTNVPQLAGGGPVPSVVEELLVSSFGPDPESGTRNGPLFIGFNCCPPWLIRPILESLQRCRHPLARQCAILSRTLERTEVRSADKWANFAGWAVYPNSGEMWDPGTQTWGRPSASTLDPENDAFWQHHVPVWSALGATIIGGCCRIGPQGISALARVVLG